MEKLLFESEGSPGKRKKALQICGVLIMVCGGALALLGMAAPSYVEGKGVIILLGLGAIVVGGVFLTLPNYDFTTRAFLRIYEGHVEGRQVAPTREFNLKYEHIYNVKKTEFAMNELLVIEGEHVSYAVLVDDVKTAYRIISDKLDELEKI